MKTLLAVCVLLALPVIIFLLMMLSSFEKGYAYCVARHISKR
jgi:hypothetical protein